MDEPSGNEQFFNAHNFVAQNVCHVSENQNFCLRQHFITHSLKMYVGIDVHTSGTKKSIFSFGYENFELFSIPPGFTSGFELFFSNF